MSKQIEKIKKLEEIRKKKLAEESEENRRIRKACLRYLKTEGRAKTPYSRQVFYKCCNCGEEGIVMSREVSLCGMVRAARSEMICCSIPDVCRVETLQEKEERERCEKAKI